MKRTFTLMLLVMLFIVGSIFVVPATAETATASTTEPTLLIKSSSSSKATVLSDYGFVPGKNVSRYLYYGTTNGEQIALTAGTLTSDDETVMTIARDGERYIFRAISFGTTTLTYTDGNVTYSQEIKIGLPATGFYKERNRTEENYISSAYPLARDTDTVIWMMSESGFTANDVKGLSLEVRQNNTNYAVTAGGSVIEVPWASNPSRYDIMVTINGDELKTENASIQFTEGKNINLRVLYRSGKNNSSVSLVMLPPPGLLYSTNPTSTATAITSQVFAPDNSISSHTWYLWYMTENGEKIALTEGELTSSDENVVSVITPLNSDFYRVTFTGHGTATLTYADGNVRYTTQITVAFPEYEFFTAQMRTGNTRWRSSNWYELTDGTGWFMRETGFSAAERENITVQVLRGNTPVPDVAYTWVERTAGSGIYDMKLTLPNPGNDKYTLYIKQGILDLVQKDVSVSLRGQHLYIGNDVIIGFAAQNKDLLYFTGTYGKSSTEQDTHYTLLQNPEPELVAADILRDALGSAYYKKIDNGSAELKATKFWIEVLNGESDTFSFSKDSCVLELNGNYTDENWPKIYYKEGHTADAYICAAVEAKVRGETVAGYVRLVAKSDYIPAKTYDCEELGVLTVEGINNLLLQIGEEVKNIDTTNVTGRVRYTVNLAETDYTGTILIPAALDNGQKATLVVQGKKNGVTRLIGGIDLNDTQGCIIHHMTFIAPSRVDNTEIRAIYNGKTSAQNSVFYGYDVALDASNAPVYPSSECVFINNDIAVRFDLGNSIVGAGGAVWKNNTFLNNGIAVQVLSLNGGTSPYYFRISDSNFINNDTDFDIRSGGTLYLYKNYFGEYIDGKPNGNNKLRLSDLVGAKTESAVDKIVKRCKAKVSTTNGSRVITNPRWKFPVADWWTGASLEALLFGNSTSSASAAMFMMPRAEQNYENILIADWENDTQLVNSDIDAENLLIDGSAFDESGEKKIDIVEGEQEIYLGSWIFD